VRATQALDLPSKTAVLGGMAQLMLYRACTQHGHGRMNAHTKILIVDDEEVVRLSYTRILAGPNCQVHAAWSWLQVAEVMQQDPCDVVLLDLRMPGMDGISVLKAIKQHWPESEVIVITGYPTLESAKQAVSLGAYDYLTKPVNPEQVIQASNAAWQHKRWALHRAGPANDINAQRGSSELPDGLPHQPDFSRTSS
jgi:DNA-binding NtrC family response regulator